MNNIKYDLKRIVRLADKEEISLSSLQKLRIIISSRGLKAIAAYRLHRHIETLQMNWFLFPIKIFSLVAATAVCFAVRVLYGIHIHNQARIGTGFYIGHFGGIFIGKCQIGKHCSIAQHVSIGSNSSSASETGPIIQDHVWIGPHVTISGDVVIESHATIVTGSVVTKNVKKNTLVMGNPARVINSCYDNSYLL
jgi:serine O-acetyltransferase